MEDNDMLVLSSVEESGTEPMCVHKFSAWWESEARKYAADHRHLSTTLIVDAISRHRAEDEQQEYILCKTPDGTEILVCIPDEMKCTDRETVGVYGEDDGI